MTNKGKGTMKTLVIVQYQNMPHKKLYIPLDNTMYLKISSTINTVMIDGREDSAVAQFPTVMNGTYTWYILPYKVSWLDRLLGV